VKIPSETIQLSELGYTEGDYWVTLPKTITEGWLYDFQVQREEEERAAEERKRAGQPLPSNAEQTRQSMLTMLELVSAWNLDDEDGKQMPLIRDLDARTQAVERAAVIRELPLDVLLHLMNKITATDKLKEMTKDFSNGS